jgi:hypothetical protein
MKRLFTILFALIGVNYFAQSFSGSIEFKYYTLRDTSLNTYWVKDSKIKLDQYSKKNNNTIEGSFIFDLEGKDIKVVNPKRKVWSELKSEIPPVLKGKCDVTKGKDKTINGLKCHEYVVKNTEENTIITYYLTTEHYDFFIPMMELWNRKDKQSIYFSKIKGLAKGTMPVLSEERSIEENKFVSKLEITKLTKSEVDNSKLAVPEEYKKFDQ